MLNETVKRLRMSEDILLIAHVSPDGDTLGSCFALYGALTAAGKRVQMVCDDPVPHIYRFLPFSDRLRTQAQAESAETAVAIDCADEGRMGSCVQLFHRAQYTLNIDHHGTNTQYGQVHYVYRAGGAGELVLTVLETLEYPITAEIASCLYAAIATDTGNFSYSNTRAPTFLAASRLLSYGIDLPELNRRLFRCVPLKKAKLRALAIQKMRLYEDGQIGYAALTLEDFAACGASAEDNDGIVDAIRDIETVEAAILLREEKDGSLRVSLRGKSKIDVSGIAAAFGGGGHRLAAGCTMHGPIDEAGEEVLKLALTAFRGA